MPRLNSKNYSFRDSHQNQRMVKIMVIAAVIECSLLFGGTIGLNLLNLLIPTKEIILPQSQEKAVKVTIIAEERPLQFIYLLPDPPQELHQENEKKEEEEPETPPPEIIKKEEEEPAEPIEQPAPVAEQQKNDNAPVETAADNQNYTTNEGITFGNKATADTPINWQDWEKPKLTRSDLKGLTSPDGLNYIIVTCKFTIATNGIVCNAVTDIQNNFPYINKILSQATENLIFPPRLFPERANIQYILPIFYDY